MKEEVTGFISALLIAVVLVANLLPTLHTLTHEELISEEIYLSENIQNAVADCELCDFKSAFSDSPVPAAAIDLHIPTKESIYIISMEERVLLSPKSFFSLRAPPALNS